MLVKINYILKGTTTTIEPETATTATSKTANEPDSETDQSYHTMQSLKFPDRLQSHVTKHNIRLQSDYKAHYKVLCTAIEQQSPAKILACLQQMQYSGDRIDSARLSTSIVIFTKHDGYIDDAIKYLKILMKQLLPLQNINPGYLFSPIIAICKNFLRNNDISRFEGLIRMLTTTVENQYNIEVLNVLLVSVLLRKEKRWEGVDDAWMFFKRFVGGGYLVPNVRTFEGLVAGVDKFVFWSPSLRVFDYRGEESGSGGARDRGNADGDAQSFQKRVYDMLDEILATMKSHKIEPSTKILMDLLQIYTRFNRPDLVAKLIRSVKNPEDRRKLQGLAVTSFLDAEKISEAAGTVMSDKKLSRDFYIVKKLVVELTSGVYHSLGVKNMRVTKGNAVVVMTNTQVAETMSRNLLNLTDNQIVYFKGLLAMGYSIESRYEDAFRVVNSYNRFVEATDVMFILTKLKMNDIAREFVMWCVGGGKGDVPEFIRHKVKVTIVGLDTEGLIMSGMRLFAKMGDMEGMEKFLKFGAKRFRGAESNWMFVEEICCGKSSVGEVKETNFVETKPENEDLVVPKTKNLSFISISNCVLEGYIRKLGKLTNRILSEKDTEIETSKSTKQSTPERETEQQLAKLINKIQTIHKSTFNKIPLSNESFAILAATTNKSMAGLVQTGAMFHVNKNLLQNSEIFIPQFIQKIIPPTWIQSVNEQPRYSSKQLNTSDTNATEKHLHGVTFGINNVTVSLMFEYAVLLDLLASRGKIPAAESLTDSPTKPTPNEPNQTENESIFLSQTSTLYLEKFFFEFLKSGFPISPRNYETLILSYCKIGQFSKVLQILKNEFKKIPMLEYQKPNVSWVHSGSGGTLRVKVLNEARKVKDGQDGWNVFLIEVVKLVKEFGSERELIEVWADLSKDEEKLVEGIVKR
ncbi:hypothetical protein HK098_006855 [Nowakowskiella sp. JEL0407]|nr:hypothetical protein HK098_006855 [Nowakowskiella sp. JEL0407]